MRVLLLHNRIYRAFPELDPYSDERCRKFIRAAQRGLVRRLFHWSIIVLVFALLLVGGLAGTAWLISVLFDAFDTDRSTALALGPLLIPVCAAPLLSYLTRDWLLRRRVRWVLRTRGTCPVCRYSLVGLPVSPGHTVRCPECALETEVDPSLGELVVDETGMTRFQPPPPRLPRFFTPPRVRILKRAAIVTALVIGVGVPSLWIAYELWLRHQAGIALAEKPGAEALTALVEANQPPGSEGGANAWDVLQEAIVLRGVAEGADQALNPEAAGEEVYAEFFWISHGLPTGGTPEDALQYARSEQKARRWLEVYRKHGVYAALDRMAQSPRVVHMIDLPPGEPLFDVALPDLGQIRHLARINAARMKVAADQGDLAEYISALEATLALARIGMLEPLRIQRMVGEAVEALAFGCLQDLLQSHPAPEWLDAVDAAIDRQRVSVPPGYAWEGERLYTIDAIAWVFSDPARVRWGRFSTDLSARFYEQLAGRLGTYASNRDELNARFEEVAALTALPRWQRPPFRFGSDHDPTSFWVSPVSEDSDLALVRMLSGSLRMSLTASDQRDLARQAYPIQAALERYYASHGAYPTSLNDLVPSSIPQLPLDSWTGKPWGYRLHANAPDGDPRGYILYSFGSDGHDDGGRRSNGPNGNIGALRDKGSGTDFIINDWQPRGR